MSNTSMSLEDAFSVAEQLSPMPGVAHEALQSMATEIRRLRISTGVSMIADERRRQITVEGWTPEHDDDHDDGALILAAECYASSPATRADVPAGWPWSEDCWKPGDDSPRGRIWDLRRAGALIAAEIDRQLRLIDRAEAPAHYEDLKHGIHGFDAGIEVGGTRHGRGTTQLPSGLHAAVRDVAAEVGRASVLFPTWPTDPMHAVGILGEEFGELQKAIVQAIYEPHKSGRAQVRTEAIQTAAMALRFLQSLDQYAYAPSTQHTQWDAPAAPTSGA